MDGEYVDPVTKLPGENQDFHVEGKPIQLLPREDLPAGLSTKGLKPALSVFDSLHGQHLNHLVKHFPQPFTDRVLPAENPALWVGSAADQNLKLVMGCEMLEEDGDLFQRGGKVGIHVEHVLTTGHKHSRSHRVALPPMYVVVDDSKSGITLNDASSQS